MGSRPGRYGTQDEAAIDSPSSGFMLGVIPTFLTRGDSMRANMQWNWFIGLNIVVIAAFITHATEEGLRGAMTLESWVLVASVIGVLIVGTAYATTRHFAGLGLALAADILVVVVAGFSHLYPGSPDHIATIAATWGGTLGLVWAGVAILLVVAALFAVVAGVWTMVTVEERPVRGPMTV